MVIKIHKGDSIDGALNYNANKQSREVADLLDKNLLQTAKDTKAIRKVFCLRQKLVKCGKVTKPIFTVSVNPAPEDLEHLTDDDLRDIARFYMEKMGYDDQPYVVYKHHDITRTHLHIVSVTIDENGKKINDSFERIRSEKIRKEIEELWNLTPAEGHNKKVQKEARLKDEEEKVMYKEAAMTIGASELREGMRRAIRAAQRYKYRTLKEYNAVLRKYRIEAEEIEVKGRKGLRYYNTDEYGNRKTAGIKASSISREFSYPNFKQRMLENSEPDETREKIRKQVSERIRRKAESLLKKGVTEKEFFEVLEAYGIRIEKAKKEDGTVFGLTFYDIETGEILKASEVSRDLSAQKIYARLRKEGQGRSLTNEERREVFKTAWECVRKRVKEEGVSAEYAKTDADRLRGDIIEECMEKMEGASLEEIMKLTGKAVARLRELGETETVEKRKEEEDFFKKLASYAPDKDVRTHLFTMAGIITDGETGYFKETPHIRFDTERFNTGRNTGEEPLKKNETEILKKAVTGKLDEMKYQGWAPWMKVLKELKEEDKRKVLSGMTKAEVEKTLDETMTAVKAVNELLDKGFVIVPKIKDRSVIGYEIRNESVKEGEGCDAPEWLKKKLEEIKYENKMYYNVKGKVWSEEGKVRWQYSVAVRITAALKETDQLKKDKRMQQIVEYVAEFNEEVSNMIHAEYKKGATAYDMAEKIESMTNSINVSCKKPKQKPKNKKHRGIVR